MQTISEMMVTDCQYAVVEIQIHVSEASDVELSLQKTLGNQPDTHAFQHLSDQH